MITAHHEAGHIMLAEWFGAKVIFASVLPDDIGGMRAHGVTKALWLPARDNRERATQMAKVALAGPAAESIYTDEQYAPELLQEWRADWVAATKALQSVAKTPLNEHQQLMLTSRYLHELIQFLSEDLIWDRLAGIADELDAHESLDEEQLDELRKQGRLV